MIPQEYQFLGEGVLTLHDYGYLPPEFLRSYPVSELNSQIYTLPRSLAFFQEFFQGGIYCYANFSIALNRIFLLGGGRKLLQGKARSQPNNVSKHKVVVLSTCSPSLQIKSMTPLPNFYPGPWFQNNFIYVLLMDISRLEHVSHQ